jgi:ribosomal protein S18 acetylase RimI-like enzyme
VRELRADEWRELRELRLRALADAPTAFLRTLAEAQRFDDAYWQESAAAGDGRAWFVCELDGELAGLAAGFLEEETAHLVAMWVAPLHRRIGLGRQLVDRVVAWAQENGAPRVTLEVNERLEVAVGLYERAGFESTGARRPLPTDPGHDAVELRLELSR